MRGLGRLLKQGQRLGLVGFSKRNNHLLYFSASRTVSSSSNPFTSPPPNSFPLSSPIWNPFQGQRRTMFIQTQSTPNPSSLMFYPGKPVMDVGSADFPNARSAMNSPLARALYGVDGKLALYDYCPVFLSAE